MKNKAVRQNFRVARQTPIFQILKTRQMPKSTKNGRHAKTQWRTALGENERNYRVLSCYRPSFLFSFLHSLPFLLKEKDNRF